MKRIAFFQSDLGVGGIQKSIVNLLRNLDTSKVQADLYLTEPGSEWEADLPESVRVIRMKPLPRVYSFLPFDLGKKRVESDPAFRAGFPQDAEYDLAVDFNSYQFSCAMGALSVPAGKRVMWIHNDVAIKLRNEWKYRVLWHFFRGKFKYYYGFVPVSGALIEPFRAMSGITDKPFTVIPNYIDVEEIRRKVNEPVPGFRLDPACFNVVALGRLCHQKGYDIMLDVFAEAHRQRSDLRLYIIGDGPDRRALEEQRDRLGLADVVTFLGSQPNPFAYMDRMDALLSTSRYEGQGMNIMEAMVLGLPVICPKHLEQYIEGLQGTEDLVGALVGAYRMEKCPDDLADYNGQILQRVLSLCGEK